MKKWVYRTVIIVLLTCIFASADAVSEKTSILFILDASGSMAQPFGSESKMDAAKRIFADLLKDIPKEANVGLEVYGHRGDKDCSVIEILNPISPLNIAAIEANVKKLVPKRGATPIASSLSKGTEALKRVAGRKAIILISDGEETCGGDPIATAGKIRNEMGIDVRIHVVGMAVNDKEKTQLSSVAAAGGGRYYSANNADQLKKSLSEIKEKVIELPSADIFVDEFDKPGLAPEWEILNDTPESRSLEDGKYYVISSPGTFNDESVQNMLLYRPPIKPKNYEVMTRFKSKLTAYGNKGDEQQWSGLIFYADKNNIIGLVITGFYGYYTGGSGSAVLAYLFKIQGGKWVTSMNQAVYRGQKEGPVDYFLKIEKQGFKYSGFFSLDNQKWEKVGMVGMIGKKLKPGIFAVRGSNAGEVITEFDSLRIKEIK